MSIHVNCDGCGDELRASTTCLKGRREGTTRGGGVPDGTFHLCYPCASAAFDALRQWQKERVA